MRVHPAIDVIWPTHPGLEIIERLLAAVDEHEPLAAEDLPAGVRLYFRSPDVRDRVLTVLGAGSLGATAAAHDVEDENWAARSQADLGPVEVGRLVVTPPWAHPEAAQPATRHASTPAARGVVIIKPAMGFGSGHHASTRVALALLQRAPVDGASVLDVGTGSGVLALAAWRLGAGSAMGFDHDPDALHSARESVALNPGAAATVTLRDMTLDEAAGRCDACDIVTANLTGGLLTRSAGTLATLVQPGGCLVLSGILSDEADLVVEAFDRLGWHVVDRLDEAEWVGLLLRRTTSPSGPRARSKGRSAPRRP